MTMKRVRRFCRHNKLALLVSLFGMFWCGVAALMISIYSQIARREEIPFTEPPPVKSPCVGHFCAFYGTCMVNTSSNTPYCKCVHNCEDAVISPLCGSDKRSYKNQCHLHMSSCLRQRRIKAEHDGECADPCDGKTCDGLKVCRVNDEGQPTCTCDAACDQIISPVCGSDDMTYSNACLLRQAACNNRREITIQHAGACRDDHPCNSLTCGPNSDCVIDRMGVATCVCPPPTCEKAGQPVCGTDGVTYPSTCELRLQACENSALTTVSHSGPCDRHTEDQGPCREIQCPFNATCIVKGGRPNCRCPMCKEQYEPVCGTNGINYENECMVRQENCRENKTVRVEHRGLCTNDGCATNKTACQFFSLCQIEATMSRCVCPSHCEQNGASVCGTDGQTHASECDLRVASCKRHENIYIASFGDCAVCNGIHCKFGAECRDGQCVCPTVCPNPHQYRPVCATDGVTYKSECEMRKQSCRTGNELEVVKISECDDDVLESGSGEGSGGDGFVECDETACLFGGTCQLDSEGYSKCSCGFSCDAIRSPVCGTDGNTYGNKCELQAASCKLQRLIEVHSMDSCDEMAQVLCDGMDPVIDTSTGQAYQCSSQGGCPAGTYCHQPFDKCCNEEHMSDNYIRDCMESKYGCCSDGQTIAPGPFGSGCPDMCQCNAMGSIGNTCNPNTRQCSCKPGVGGPMCDRCQPGYWGLHLIQERNNAGCMPCNCHNIGSRRADCHQMTGRCMCRHGYDGLKCNRCKDTHTLIDENGCSNAALPTAVPSTTRSRKTTRHIHPSKYQPPMTPKKPKSTLKPFTGPYIRISDRCGVDGCNIPNSHCEKGLCQCDEGYIPTMGNTQCSEVKVGPSLETEILDTDFNTCTINPCLHGGVCKVDDSLGYRCLCPLGYSGIICKQRGARFTIPSFSDSGFLALKPLGNLSGDFQIVITFRTMNTDGILLFSSQREDGTGQYISIAISNRQVEFRFDSGSGATQLRHPDPVSVNMYHRVTAKRIGQHAMLTVDDSEPAVTTVLALDSNLDMSGKVFLGYLPERFSFIQEKIGVNIGLVGCIQSLTAGPLASETTPYDLEYPGSHQILDGLDVGSCDGNPCRSIPCQNGGTCAVVNGGIYQCYCPKGYKGSNCEGPVDACTNSPCHPSAACSLADGGEITCHCPEGREGQYCEYEKLAEIMVPQFRGESYMIVPLKDNLAHQMKLEVWFLTRAKNGMLLFSSQFLGGDLGDFISVNLVNLFVEFRFELGNGPVTIRSSRTVELDKWHRLVIQRSDREASLVLDDSVPVTGSSPGTRKQLQLSGSLYIGGYKDILGLPTAAGIMSNFSGAIQRIYINGNLLDLDLALEKKDISMFRGHPCQLNPCLNGGVCVPKLEKAECNCPKKYAGKHCGQIAGNLEMKLPVKFTGSTYLQYYNDVSSGSRAQRTNEFQFRLRTHQSNGLLLFQNQGQKITEDYLALAVVRGHVEFSYNLGHNDQDNLFRLRSPVAVNDGRWHTVYAHRDKQHGRLQVDQDNVIGSASGRSTQLNTDGKLWLGGKSNLPWKLPSEYYHGFKGCIGDLLINKKELSFIENRTGPGNSIDFCH